MNILIDIGHPAHVHLFRNFASEMENKGNSVLFTAREKEFEIQLLEAYKLKYFSLGKKYTRIISKIFGIFGFVFRILKISKTFKPDIFLSHGSMYAAIASKIINKPHISFEDTGNMEQISIYKPFTDVILTPDAYKTDHGKIQIKYPGYHELAYLHPKRFTPNTQIFDQLNIKENEKYVLLRFVKWEASHDIGHPGITEKNKKEIVKQLSKFAHVFISSEKELPLELQPYKLPIKAEEIHDVIANASLVYGESATMVSEAAVLGVPGIYLDNKGRFYTDEQEERYNLVYNYSESLADQEKSIEKALEIINNDDFPNQCAKKRKILLKETIDVTAFLIWFVENYPTSVEMIKRKREIYKEFS